MKHNIDPKIISFLNPDILVNNIEYAFYEINNKNPYNGLIFKLKDKNDLLAISNQQVIDITKTKFLLEYNTLIVVIPLKDLDKIYWGIYDINKHETYFKEKDPMIALLKYLEFKL